MSDVSTFRLYALRAMYLLIALGMGLQVWPMILAPDTLASDAKTVVRAMLGALTLLCILGLRYPLRMLPVLLFELAWKLIWVLAFALPLWLRDALDANGQETLFACLLGVVLVPLVLPWGYVVRHFVRERGDRWRAVR